MKQDEIYYPRPKLLGGDLFYVPFILLGVESQKQVKKTRPYKGGVLKTKF
jgi:hypothetical protein